ncbi:HEPN domain-containing protein [Rhodococcus jostii]|uniref:HEPN domain-containing protein n=1 Tax=Rhodococcus jostii TaxID=132919 RepID=UPI0011D0FD03|nr:HEPN domain-containing protein [Rhodococcus jostii]
MLDDFLADLTRARHLLGLIGDFRSFGSSSPISGNKPEDVWPEASQLLVRSTTVRTDLPILSGSMVLYLAGRYEFFIRQVVEAAAQEMASRASTYDAMPTNLRSALRANTLNVCQSPKKFGYDDAQSMFLLRQLVDAASDTSGNFTINAEMASITDSNMRPSVMADVLKRVGLLDFWKEVGKQSSIKLFYSEKDEGRCAAQAQASLNSLMELRNQVAHPTASTTFPDYSAVLSNVEYLELLAKVTAEIVNVHLAVQVP